MKRILLAAVAFLAITACNSNKPQPTEISGVIKNLETGFALVESRGLTDTVLVNADGSFTYTIETDAPHYYTVRAGRNRHVVFLNPGSKSLITFDVDVNAEDKSPKFDGDNSICNTTILEVNNVFNGITSNFQALYILPKDEFQHKVDSVIAKATELVNPLAKDNKLFAQYESDRIKYKAIAVANNYPFYNAYLQGIEASAEELKNECMDEIALDNAAYLSMNEYTSLVSGHIQKIHASMLAEKQGTSEFERLISYFEIVDSLVGKNELGELFKHNQVRETLQWSKFEVATNIANHFLEVCSAIPYTESVQRLLNRRMLLAPGAEAPKFSLPGFDGQTYSLDDFKGQLVYLDFWATWCGPCRREIPHLKRLKDEYKGKPIAFVAISVDDNKAAWEKMVKDDKLDGYQLHAPNAWLEQATIDYQVAGIPTFVLIDANGKIIDYPAPRPSEDETTLLIDKYLKDIQ